MAKNSLTVICYDEACNLEPWRPVEPGSPEHLALRLSVAEREELAALNDGITTTALDPEKRARWKALTERSLLYGCEGVEAQPFVGLEPRYSPADREPPVKLIPPYIADEGNEEAWRG